MKKYVYAIHAAGTNLYKIGEADDVERRVWEDIQPMSPLPLKIIVIEKQRNWITERRLHKIFHVRRHHGEWFVADICEIRMAFAEEDFRVFDDREGMTYPVEAVVSTAQKDAARFISTRIEYLDGGEVETRTIYDTYLKWPGGRVKSRVPRVRLSRMLRKQFPEIERVRASYKRRPYLYRGIILVDQ